MLSPEQFYGLAPEQVKVSALMPHREYEHGPGFTRDMNGREYAPKRSAEEWHSLVDDIRANGVREPIEFAYDPRSRTGYLGEGNSRLQAAAEAGADTVPVVGRRTSYVDDRPSYAVPGEPRLKRGEHGYFPADFKVSGVLPKEYMG